MWVGARGAMSRNATTVSSSWTFVAGTVPATILQNRQSRSAGIRTSGEFDGRHEVPNGADDALGHERVDRLDRDAADDVLEVDGRLGRRRHEHVIGRVADPAPVAEPRLEQHARLTAHAAPGPAGSRSGSFREEL